MNIKNRKENVIRELQKINNKIKDEDIKAASTEDLEKYILLNLEIQKKLEILDAIKQ